MNKNALISFAGLLIALLGWALATKGLLEHNFTPHLLGFMTGVIGGVIIAVGVYTDTHKKKENKKEKWNEGSNDA